MSASAARSSSLDPASIAVSITPGQMHITRIPQLARSRASGRVSGDHAALRRGVAGLADLALDPGDRRDVDDEPALAVVARARSRVITAAVSRSTSNSPTRLTSMPRRNTSSGNGAPVRSTTRAAGEMPALDSEQVDAPERRGRRVDRRRHRVAVGHVARDERRARPELGGECGALRLGTVEDHGLAPAVDEHARHPGTQAGRAARHQTDRSRYVHVAITSAPKRRIASSVSSWLGPPGWRIRSTIHSAPVRVAQSSTSATMSAPDP